MGKQDGLPGLKMGIARKHHPHVLLGFGDNRSLQITDRFNNFLDCVSRVKSDIQLRLFVAENGHFGDSFATTLGTVAAVYNLGNATVANKAGDTVLFKGPADKKAYKGTFGGMDFFVTEV